MATMTLQEFAKEINRDWTDGYSAIVQDNELRLKYEHLVVAIVDVNFDIEMLEEGFDEVHEQLMYMIAR